MIRLLTHITITAGMLSVGGVGLCLLLIAMGA